MSKRITLDLINPKKTVIVDGYYKNPATNALVSVKTGIIYKQCKSGVTIKADELKSKPGEFSIQLTNGVTYKNVYVKPDFLIARLLGIQLHRCSGLFLKDDSVGYILNNIYVQRRPDVGSPGRPPRQNGMIPATYTIGVNTIDSEKTWIDTVDNKSFYKNPALNVAVCVSTGEIFEADNLSTRVQPAKFNNSVYPLRIISNNTYSNAHMKRDFILNRLLGLGMDQYSFITLKDESRGFVCDNIGLNSTRLQTLGLTPSITDPAPSKAFIKLDIVNSESENTYTTSDLNVFDNADDAKDHQLLVDTGLEIASKVIDNSAGWSLAETVYMTLVGKKYKHESFRDLYNSLGTGLETSINKTYTVKNKDDVQTVIGVLLDKKLDDNEVKVLSSAMESLNSLLV